MSKEYERLKTEYDNGDKHEVFAKFIFDELDRKINWLTTQLDKQPQELFLNSEALHKRFFNSNVFCNIEAEQRRENKDSQKKFKRALVAELANYLRANREK